MDGPQNQVDAVRNALKSTATCSSATVSTLRDLLQTRRPSKKDASLVNQENNGRATKVGPKSRTTAITEGSAKPTSKARTGKLVKVREDDSGSPLSAKEQNVLAQETVNISLKSLTQALATKTQALTQVSKEHDRERKTSHRRLSRTPSSNGNPLQPRGVNDVAKANGKSPSVGRKASSTSVSKQDSSGGITATAECARIAFAYLRSAEADRPLEKKLPFFQLENGMLALTGKLVNLGLDSLAIKELYVLKGRFDRLMRDESQGNQTVDGMEDRKSHLPSFKERETLASLLSLTHIKHESPILPLIVNYQLLVLRTIAAAKRPAILDAVWEYLIPSSSCCPSSLILCTINLGQSKEKAARQLQSLSTTLFSLCQPFLGSEVSVRHDADIQPNPRSVFTLQQAALEARIQWWSLVDHQADIESEVLEPYVKNLSTLANRSSSTPKQIYELAIESSIRLQKLLDGGSVVQGKSLKDLCFWASVESTLSTIAQDAGDVRAALGHAESAWAVSEKTGKPFAQSSLKLRLATLVLENLAMFGCSGPISRGVSDEEAVKTGLGFLTSNPSYHDLTEMSTMLAIVMALRRAAVKFLVKYTREPALSFHSMPVAMLGLSRALVFKSLQFLTNFMKAVSREAACERPPLSTSRCQSLAVQVAKGTVDSVLGILKPLISTHEVPWIDVDDSLQDCTLFVSLAESWVKDIGIQPPADFDLGQCLIKVSNLYLAFHSHRSKLSDNTISDEAVQALSRSIDILRDRSQPEQEAGMLSAKLEKYVSSLDLLGRSDEAHGALMDAINVHVKSGSSREAAKLADYNALQTVWASGNRIRHLGRLLMALNKRLQKGNCRGQGRDNFFDDPTLRPVERGILLEQQLHLIFRDLSSRRTVDLHIAKTLQEIIPHLFAIYTSSDFPLRRLRVSRAVLLLVTDHPTILNKDLVSFATEDETVRQNQALSLDDGLQRFKRHLQASWRVAKCFHEGLPRFEAIRPSLLAWTYIVDASSTWEELMEQVDEIDCFTSQLQAVASFLDMQGLGDERVAVLTSISKVGELRSSPDLAALILSKTQVASQYLRLGYTGRAGSLIADARSLLFSSLSSPEAILQLQTVDAEFLLDVGDVDKCRQALKNAALLATENSEIQKIAGPSATSSGRIRYNKFTADTSSVLSTLALESGDIDEALAQAKRSMRLHQRTWAVIENKHFAKPDVTMSETMESDMDALTEDIARIALDSGSQPRIMSMTHEKLRGPAFWPFVSSLVRSLLQLAHVYSQLGLFQEAVCYCEQAEKIANAVQADALLMLVYSNMSVYCIRCRREKEAQQLLDRVKGTREAPGNTQEVAIYHRSMARLEHLRGNEGAEWQSMESAIATLEALISSRNVGTMDRSRSCASDLEETLSRVQLDDSEMLKRPLKFSRAKKSQRRAVIQSSHAAISPQAVDESKNLVYAPRLTGLLATLLAEKAVILLRQGSVAEACEVVQKTQTMLTGREDTVLHQIASFKNLLAQAMQLLNSDFVFNVLPESTISFPAIVRAGKDSTEMMLNTTSCKKSQSRSLSPRKGGRKFAQPKVDFASLLQQARDCLVDVRDKALKIGGTALVHALCNMVSQVTLLLSAANIPSLDVSLEPLAPAQLLEISRDHAFQGDINSIATEKRQSKDQSLLTWPESNAFPDTSALPLPSRFQREYIDVIPESWTAISITLNETRDEFYVTRYHAHETPFILRLPISRQKADDMDDEEPFTFESGKKELLEIISLSNNSTHDTRDMSVKGARSAWWAEREALDARLRDLLLNMENIWLGGFRGIFSQHRRHPHLLTQFQKSFENILDRHLPSRQGTNRATGKAKGRKTNGDQHVTFDPRVLELFVGLGNATIDSLDIDEALMDLVYFIVDILQFNGERNAYDEIDFDAIVVETIDALKAYHDAASHETAETTPTHTILILDKQLHVFPWESLPCLDGQAITRVPSMKALRDRILIQHRQIQKRRQQHLLHQPNSPAASPSHEPQQQQGYHSSRSHTAYILNPSNDLTHTESVLGPALRSLPPHPHPTTCAIPNLTGRAPSEADFAALLTYASAFLYFGHGSGAQYIRRRTVKRLARCASTVWLMGCSSGAVTELGEFEPQGSVLAYLVAGWSDGEGRRREVEGGVGAMVEGGVGGGDGEVMDVGEEEEEEEVSPCMAVCATLWDVTDKDIDRFSLRLGEEWGLWPGMRSDARSGAKEKAVKGGKTPRKRGKSRAEGKNEVESESQVRDGRRQKGRSLAEALARSREECYLRYLNGAAPVVYGVPVWLDD
ncbi:MAG: hypothetical protein Q9165_006372 [Trypethelium subeluteriae]